MPSSTGYDGSPQAGAGSDAYLPTHRSADSLADVLERVLDKGIVIVGDIQVRLLDIELLTIKLRLMVASVDKAREMGINWWEEDEFVTAGQLGDDDGASPFGELAKRIEALEGRVGDRPSRESAPSRKSER